MKVKLYLVLALDCFGDLVAFFDDPYVLGAFVSLVIQIVVLGLLLYGYAVKRQLKFRQHGIIMAIAVFLHLSTILVIMIPSFVLAVVPYYIIPFPAEAISITGLIHGIAGIIAIVLGLGLVGAWRFSKDFQGCFKRKNFMRITITAWIIALLLGFVLYGLFYWSLLFG